MHTLLAFWICLQISCLTAFSVDNCLGNTEYGMVQGNIKLSRYERQFCSYTGIPYAKAPVGDLRFAEPQSPDKWTGCILDATQESPVCLQRNYLFSNNPEVEGQEDCLYINVYVPKTHHYEKLPVMIFIHWGGFIAGRSSGDYLGPEYFMDKDVVLVTFNYRLGPFGFLTTLDDEAPGNYAFKDQVLALKWVKENIENFNGDSNLVTIFGQSAGAGSVHMHLLSPASNGLFHRAISQSGNALAGWIVPTNDVQKSLTTMQAQFVGCGNYTESSKNLVECLRKVSGEEIMKTQDYFKAFYSNPIAVYGTVIETKTERNLNPFITKNPAEYILSGEIKKVPWMTGVVENEGNLRAPSLIIPTEEREALNRNFSKIFTDYLVLLYLSTNNTESLYKNMTEFYFDGKEYVDINDPTTIKGMTDSYTDRGFYYSFYQSIQLHAQQQHYPIYLYHFSYEGEYSFTKLFSSTNEEINYHWGVSHCDELIYLFRSPSLFKDLKHPSDIQLSNAMIELWTNFAKNGEPAQQLGAWNPVNIEMESDQEKINGQFELNHIYGNITTGSSNKTMNGFYKKRMLFWTNSDILENQVFQITSKRTKRLNKTI